MQKIMFNELFGLQQATFDGTKTMTRRAVPDKIMKDALAYQSNHIYDKKSYEKYILDHAPYKVGQIIAIAQRYSQLEEEIEHLGLPLNLKEEIKKHKGYKNKMYVRAEDMPRYIKITGIRIEGLASISDEDCLREGIYELKLCESEDCVYTFQGNRCGMWKTPYYAYKELIDRLNRRGFFESNPLVYAYTYELIDFYKNGAPASPTG